MQLWVADSERGLMRKSGDTTLRVDAPGEALCACWGMVCCAGGGRCGGYDPATGEKRWDAALPTGVCALAGIRDRVCAVSQDADSVTALSAFSGETLFSAPAGVYPRDICPNPQGTHLAVAGGAAGEILVLDDNLRCVKKYQVPGTVCGVCFLPQCLMALCAVEDGDLSARLLRLSFRGVWEEVWARPLTPSCLCALPGNACAVGCYGMVACLKGGKAIAPGRSVPCPVRLRPGKWGLMLCDPWEGRVSLFTGSTLYQGKAPQDAVVMVSD